MMGAKTPSSLDQNKPVHIMNFEQQQKFIIRQTCLKVAAEAAKQMPLEPFDGELGVDRQAEKVIQMARMFEQYVNE